MLQSLPGCPRDELILAYLDGELAAPDVAQVDVHVDACPACATLVGTLGQVALASGAPARPAVSSTAALEPGTRIGRYLILGEVGAGALGEVYAAYDPDLDRKIALKLLRRDRPAPADDHAAQRRLLREGQALARLNHPNVVRVYDVGVFSDEVFVAMELVEGQSLRAWLDAEPRSWQKIALVFAEAGQGLMAAHAAGLVHRDFKPDNVLIGPEGRACVTDFGLARHAQRMAGTGSPPPPLPDLLALRPDELLTQTGARVGTPAYMAPEQHFGYPVDERSDQFSFCVALFEALSGQRPFSGDTVAEIVEAAAAGRVRACGRPVPQRLLRLVTRGLSADPAARHRSMELLVDELVRCATRRARSGRLALGALGMAALALLLWRHGQPVPAPCGGAGAHWSAVWNDARRAKVRAAILSTGTPYASEAARALERSLDDYGHSWTAAHTEACQATRVSGEQSEAVLNQRMSCLHWRLAEVDALVELLGRSNADQIAQARQASERLPDVGACANMEALNASFSSTERLGAPLHEVRGGLAKATALLRLARYQEVVEQVTPLVARAHDLGHRATEAVALSLLGQAQGQLGELEAAELNLRRAVFRAEAAHDDAMATRTSAKLASLLSVRHKKQDEATAWIEHAASTLDRLGEDSALRAEVTETTADIAIGRGEYKRALQLETEALALWQSARGPDHLDLATGLSGRAVALRHLGDYSGALADERRSLAIIERALGPNNPRAAFALNGIGNILDRLHRSEEAFSAYRRALTIFEGAFGGEHLHVAKTLVNLGGVRLTQGRYDEAFGYEQRALSLTEKNTGPSSADTGIATLTLCELRLAQQRNQDAAQLCLGALAILEAKLGPQHPAVAYALTRLGRSQLGVGRALAAVDSLRRALALAERADVEPAERAQTLFALAEALWTARRDAAARGYAEQARAVLKGIPAETTTLAAVETWLRQAR